MHPKKQTNKVSTYFRASEMLTSREDTAPLPDMVLTREDLVATLRDFKVELCREFKRHLRTSVEQLKADLTEKLTTLRQDVDAVGSRLLEVEGQTQSLTSNQDTMHDAQQSFRAQLQQVLLKAEDLENRTRRENIRIRNLEEGAEGPDLEAFVSGLFAEILAPQQLKIKIDKVHRVGALHSGNLKRPWDVLVKLHSFKVKEAILSASRKLKEIPVSVCSPGCQPGFRKVAIPGEQLCCFHCITCPPGEITNETGSSECLRCPWDQWPNESRERCVQKTIEFFSYEDPLGATLATMSISSSAIPVVILALFIHYRNTPIVRANNCSLSYLLLVSLTLCFLCSLTFIGYPSSEKCLLRQVAFGITFSLCVSCVLAKTITVVIAFNATKPNSDLRAWAGPKLSYMVICIGTLIPTLMCATWLLIAPPISEYNTHSQPGKIILECNEGSPVAFWCMLGYLGLLSAISFIVAFLARKLPDSFNEAKCITFSMLAFLSVWLSFIPAYLSTRGKYMAAMEIFAILTSSWSMVSCIFFTKCYTILLRPETNTKHHLLGREKAQRM
ncbi:vomeronasal type-2 receptor 26-like [Lissotriton helveticus]